jgi:hypothetical protein
VPGGLVLADFEKAEVAAYSLEAQFQPVEDLSYPAFIELFNDALRAYIYPP